jgi:hypothetical protein
MHVLRIQRPKANALDATLSSLVQFVASKGGPRDDSFFLEITSSIYRMGTLQ